MKLSLRQIVINKKLSEETTCFSADLYLDGVRIGYISNRGTGGCHDYHIDNDKREEVEKRAKAWVVKRAEEGHYDKGGLRDYMIEHADGIEAVTDELLENHESRKLSNKRELCFTIKGKEYEPGQYSVLKLVKGETKAQALASFGATKIAKNLTEEWAAAPEFIEL